jgi:hypothetical protein
MICGIMGQKNGGEICDHQKLSEKISPDDFSELFQES